MLRNTSIETNVRRLALEFLVTLTEQAPAMIRKTHGFVSTMLEAGMHFAQSHHLHTMNTTHSPQCHV
jgi:hypothetical protein